VGVGKFSLNFSLSSVFCWSLVPVHLPLLHIGFSPAALATPAGIPLILSSLTASSSGFNFLDVSLVPLEGKTF
jgi:hypothetical protein